VSRKASFYNEVELAELPVGTMMLQWEEEYEELMASWIRRVDGWQEISHDIDPEDRFRRTWIYTDHMIWSPTSAYEIIYYPRVG
jgi:hypothetical protein